MRAQEHEVLTFPNDGGCFGCSPTNPIGLRLTFRRQGDVVTARHEVPDHFHGAPGIAHGGIVATLLDEVSVEAELRQGEVLLARSTGRFFPQARAEAAP